MRKQAWPEAVSDEEEIYKENIIDHYKNPRNKKIPDVFSFQWKENNPLCGDEIVFFVKEHQNIVTETCFHGQGCAISQAAASMLTEHIKGMALKDLKKIDQDTVLKLLGIPLSPLRMKCAGLCLKTVQKGLEDYHARN